MCSLAPGEHAPCVAILQSSNTAHCARSSFGGIRAPGSEVKFGAEQLKSRGDGAGKGTKRADPSGSAFRSFPRHYLVEIVTIR